MPVERRTSLTLSEFENLICILCCESFDFDEINFYPCECGYQVCKFCWDRLKNDDTPNCPNCRKPYSEEPYMADDIPESLKEKLTAGNKDSRKPGKVGRTGHCKASISDDRKHLTNVRVLQKNLVFVIGLSSQLANEETLKSNEYFGKYGIIKKVAITHNSSNYAGSSASMSASAYLTYTCKDDALKAIQGGNGQYVFGRTLKCSLGTTKYCSRYLRNQECTQADCMYLHDVADQEASFTKADMQLHKHSEYETSLMEDFNRRERRKEENKKISKISRQNTNLNQNNYNPNASWSNMDDVGNNPWKVENKTENVNFQNENFQISGHNPAPGLLPMGATTASKVAENIKPPTKDQLNNYPRLANKSEKPKSRNGDHSSNDSNITSPVQYSSKQNEEFENKKFNSFPSQVYLLDKKQAGHSFQNQFYSNQYASLKSPDLPMDQSNHYSKISINKQNYQFKGQSLNLKYHNQVERLDQEELELDNLWNGILQKINDTSCRDESKLSINERIRRLGFELNESVKQKPFKSCRLTDFLSDESDKREMFNEYQSTEFKNTRNNFKEVSQNQDFKSQYNYMKQSQYDQQYSYKNQGRNF